MDTNKPTNPTEQKKPKSVSPAEQRLRDREASLRTLRDTLLALVPVDNAETLARADKLVALDKQLEAIEYQRNKVRMKARGPMKRRNDRRRSKRVSIPSVETETLWAVAA